MIQLRILGPPALDISPGGEPSELVGQPKRLAVLAYLAIAGGRHLIPRDQVLGVFWPELPEERARHALSQALHVLRRALGEGADAIVAQGERLGVDPTRLWCDVTEFRHELKQGDRAKALELYRGSLLDGVFIDDAPEFEHWLEERRAGLREEASKAAARLAEEAVKARDARAVSFARRAAELAPYDSAATTRLVALLDAEGNSGAALAAYEMFTRRLLDDCGLPPSAELRAQVERIRSRDAERGLALLSPDAPTLAPTDPVVLPRRRRNRLAMSLLTAAVIGFALWSLFWRREALQAAPVEAASLGRVAVLPFTVQGDLTRGDSLGRDLVELLGSRLDGAGALRAVPTDSVLHASDRASGGGIGLGFPVGSLIDGSVTGSAGTVHIRAVWRRAADRSLIGEATVEGRTDQLFGLLDQLVIQLLAKAQVGPRHALARAAALSTTSLPALKAFLAGEQAFAEGHFTTSSQDFERAATVDSGFALAQYRLGVTALWAEDYPLAAADAGLRARRHSDKLFDRDRRLVAGFEAWRRGDRDTASSHFLSILANDHDNLEAWFQLGETQFHYNPAWGQPIAESRDAFRQAIRLDPDHWGALWHLAMLDGLEGRTAELDRELDHLLHLGPGTDYRVEIAALRACSHHDAAARSGLTDALRAVGEGRLHDMAWRCAVYGRDLEGAEAMARLLIERHAVKFSEIQGRFILAHLLMARGQRSRALAQLDSLGPLSGPMSLSGRTEIGLLPGAPGSRGELDRLLHDWQNRPPRTMALEETLWLGRLEAILGHRASAIALAQRLDTATDDPNRQGLFKTHAREIRALIRDLEGESPKALRELEGAAPVVWFGIMVSAPDASRSSGRFELARLLAGAGRIQEALRWYGSLSELSMYDLLYAPLAHLRRAELFEQLGDTSATAEEYARFLELWKDADPELQPMVAQVREKLTRLSAHR